MSQAPATTRTAHRTMNTVIHAAFRRDLDRLGGALERYPSDSRERADQLTAMWDNLAHQLHLHHQDEETLFWPAFRELGVDRATIGIGGNSAGGGLAAGLALLARDRGELPIRFQLLIYPMIDDRQITPSSTWIDPIWPPSANTFGWTSYIGDGKGGNDVSAYAAPARATELTGLPPTLVSVGAIDGFCDEDVDYAHGLTLGEPLDVRPERPAAPWANSAHGRQGGEQARANALNARLVTPDCERSIVQRAAAGQSG